MDILIYCKLGGGTTRWSSEHFKKLMKAAGYHPDPDAPETWLCRSGMADAEEALQDVRAIARRAGVVIHRMLAMEE